jgi:hypothetical protein
MFNIDSNEFKMLPIEHQHQIIIDIKNASRAPNQQRVDEMTSSGSALDFSKKQIQNLVHRAALTDRAQSLAQNKSSVRHGRVVGSRNKAFVLVSAAQSGVGVRIQPQEEVNARVVDIAGMRGFADPRLLVKQGTRDDANRSVSKGKSISLDYKSHVRDDFGSGDAVDDDVPLEDILKRIEQLEDDSMKQVIEQSEMENSHSQLESFLSIGSEGIVVD